MYPGTLVLSLNAEVIYHRLMRKITELNGVPAEPTNAPVLGPKMCVPFGKILRGNAIPNTVTKTIHTDRVYSPDLSGEHHRGISQTTPPSPARCAPSNPLTGPSSWWTT